MSFIRSPFLPLFSLAANLTAVGSATYYLQSWHKFNYEEHEARMDELEGTLRGHIGYASFTLSKPLHRHGFDESDFIQAY